MKNDHTFESAIGTASANSVEFCGIRSRMYIDDLLYKRDADVT